MRAKDWREGFEMSSGKRGRGEEKNLPEPEVPFRSTPGSLDLPNRQRFQMNGSNDNLTCAPAESTAVTAFQARVYAIVRTIPCGRVATYAWLAAELGGRGAQAVGQALKRNPFAPEVPCHRVIRSDLTIGGFVGASSGAPVLRKRQLLEREGVVFDAAGKLAHPQQLYPKR